MRPIRVRVGNRFAIPATFDQGTLLFDLTSQTISDPTQEQQEEVYNGMFAGFPHGFYRYDNYAIPWTSLNWGSTGRFTD